MRHLSAAGPGGWAFLLPNQVSIIIISIVPSLICSWGVRSSQREVDALCLRLARQRVLLRIWTVREMVCSLALCTNSASIPEPPSLQGDGFMLSQGFNETQFLDAATGEVYADHNT